MQKAASVEDCDMRRAGVMWATALIMSPTELQDVGNQPRVLAPFL